MCATCACVRVRTHMQAQEMDASMQTDPSRIVVLSKS